VTTQPTEGHRIDALNRWQIASATGDPNWPEVIVRTIAQTEQHAAADALTTAARALINHHERTGERVTLDSTALYHLAAEYRAGRRTLTDETLPGNQENQTP
jgi:hypothetical protein